MKTLNALTAATIFAMHWTTMARADNCAAGEMVVDYIKQVENLSECDWRANPPDGASSYYYCFRAGASNYEMIEVFESQGGTLADGVVLYGYGDGDNLVRGGRFSCACNGCYSR